MLALGLFLFSALISFVLCFPTRNLLLGLNAIDRPNARSSHQQPTARGGGLAIICTTGLAAVLIGIGCGNLKVLAALVGAAILLAAISFTDDLISVRPSVRFGFHVLTAVAAVAAMRFPHFYLGLAAESMLRFPETLGYGLLVLWIVGYTNVFNFMDGINGLAAGQATITGFGMALLGGLTLGNFENAPVMLCLAVAGAALGFLPHNFPRPHMFLGDVGSASLGFLLAGLVAWLAMTAGWWLLIPLVLLHANFLLDAGVTLIRRILRGERWYEAHREHFYQRLVRTGRSHALVSVMEIVLQIFVLGLLVCYLRVGSTGRAVLIGIVVVLWTAFFFWAELCYRQVSEDCKSIR